jgi:hypothetical protein
MSVEFFMPEDFEDKHGEITGAMRIYAANVANRILAERGVRVYGRGGEHKSFVTYPKEMLHWEPEFTATLIDIQPIPRDTAEGLLRELTELMDKYNSAFKDCDIAERARRLLEGKS